MNWVLVVCQVVGLVAMLGALYFAAGPLWVIFAAGLVLLVVSTAIEARDGGRS